MSAKIILYIGALLLLTLASAKCDETFREKFGTEFTTAMKKWHAELLRKDMQNYKDVYNTLLTDFEPTPAEIEKFKSRLETVKEIEDHLGDSIDVDSVQSIKEFGSTVIWELVSYSLDPKILADAKKKRVVKKALSDAGANEQKELKVFQKQIYEKYHEMYQTIPEDELADNPEYTKIDQILKRVLGAEIKDLSGVYDYLAAFRIIGNFFNVPEYKLLFQ